MCLSINKNEHPSGAVILFKVLLFIPRGRLHQFIFKTTFYFFLTKNNPVKKNNIYRQCLLEWCVSGKTALSQRRESDCKKCNEVKLFSETQ
ncbi:MAG: hypothetical protein A3F91_10720 [Flavobacteria bacterium RIFCSPLOWO2_12_FULL_35_11]|nr:MAG: hypothetical protein A3F91_10720 [Flavobacteria bacterium RIFCSPLOWO2_12_FULL_35_11]